MRTLIVDFDDGESIEYPDVSSLADDDKFIHFVWNDKFFRFNWKFVIGYCEEADD